MGRYSEGLRGRVRARRAGGAAEGDGDAAHPLDRMREAEFLARRRMVRLDPDGARLAPEGHGGNHRAWMSDLDDRAFARATRGYVLDGEVVLYVGHFEPAPVRAVRAALPGILAATGLGPEAVVWVGARERDRGALSGLHLLGTVAEAFPEVLTVGDGAAG